MKRWAAVDFPSFGLENVDTVPELAIRTFNTDEVEYWLNALRTEGSFHPAAKGFKPAEGVVVFHPQGGYLFKATIEGDDKGKDWGA